MTSLMRQFRRYPAVDLDQYRRFWEASFDRLDEYLQRIQTPDPNVGEQ